MKKHVKLRHKFYFWALRPVGIVFNLMFGFRCKPIKFKKGEHYLILSNHQTVLDPAFLCMQFKAPLYIMASDTLFNTSIASRLLQYCFAPIKKKKATVDINCIKTCAGVAKDGGNIAIFPEGNRSWTDTQMYIDPSICKLIRLLKLPVILYNLKGGFGVNPRWGGKRRKGKFYGEINSTLSVEKINDLSDDELYDTICKALSVKDTQNGFEYLSKKPAECLERVFFYCPKCKKLHTLTSLGDKIFCSACDFSATYNKDLTLSGAEDFGVSSLEDWYKLQIEVIKNLKVEENKTVFIDNNVRLFDKTTARRTLIAKGQLVMTDKAIMVGEQTINLNDITSASLIGGVKLIINTANNSYFLIGHERFNAIKYILSFNVLSTTFKDDYYGL
ncbi:MAG: 1-acyl-sn-glycerol-3-phosphate acyltransferase [Clostridia bacterium]|nr:1-acyl-sn-glycerol-3-phosphate acyltransferase [Clostridia bacterium]